MNDERGCGLSNKDTRADEGVAHVNIIITVSTIAAVALWQHKDVNPMVVLCDYCGLCLFVLWLLLKRASINHVRSDTISEKIEHRNQVQGKVGISIISALLFVLYHLLLLVVWLALAFSMHSMQMRS